MNNKKNYKKGTRLDIIKTLHMASVIPNKAFAVMDTPRTYKDKIREMIKEDVLNEFRVKNDGYAYKLFVLNDYERNKGRYIEFLPEGYYENYVITAQGEARDSRNKLGGTSMRIITGAETYIMMKHAGIACDPDTKINLLKDIPLDDSENAYYNSKEVKRYTEYTDDVKEIKDINGNEKKFVVSSRITGLLISDGGIYSVYNIGRSVNNWQRGGEIKMKTHIDYMLGNKMSAPRYCENAMIILENYGSISKMINPITHSDMTAESSFDNLKSIYNRIYAVPYTLDGRHLLEIMTRPNWSLNIKDAMLSRYKRNDIEQQSIPCDAYTENDEYILLFCVPDIKKLQIFKKYAEKIGDKQKFIVLCFDFQKEMVVKSCERNCRIMETSFKKFYEHFINEYD